MKIFKLFIAISLLFISSDLLYAEETKEYKLDVADFTELKVNDHLNVEYRCSADSAGMILFRCTPDIAQQLIFTSNKSCLKIEVSDDYDYAGEEPMIRVYSSMLEKVENGSDSTIRVISNVPLKSFKARVIGNGTIVIDQLESASVYLSVVTGHGHIMVANGSTFKAKYYDVGTGTIQAGGLKASEVKAVISGTGNIDCNVTENLSIYGMGSGSVYYSGNPAKISNRSVGVKAYPVKE